MSHSPLFSQKLDCNIVFINPEELSWGAIVNGSATGLLKDIVEDRTDLALGAVYSGYDRAQVSRPSYFVNFGQDLAMITPMSIPYR